jgi:hypothetical protein
MPNKFLQFSLVLEFCNTQKRHLSHVNLNDLRGEM